MLPRRYNSTAVVMSLSCGSVGAHLPLSPSLSLYGYHRSAPRTSPLLSSPLTRHPHHLCGTTTPSLCPSVLPSPPPHLTKQTDKQDVSRHIEGNCYIILRIIPVLIWDCIIRPGPDSPCSRLTDCSRRNGNSPARKYSQGPDIMRRNARSPPKKR